MLPSRLKENAPHKIGHYANHHAETPIPVSSRQAHLWKVVLKGRNRSVNNEVAYLIGMAEAAPNASASITFEPFADGFGFHPQGVKLA